jgi:hypothetical protein
MNKIRNALTACALISALGSSLPWVIPAAAGSFPAVINLSSIDGTNGFAAYGVAPYDTSGYSVASVKDINGDGIEDMIIGAPFDSSDGDSGRGSACVVFGRASGFPEFIELIALDGTKGFCMEGVVGDQSVGINFAPGSS